MPFIPPPYSSSRRCSCGAEVPLRFLISTDPRNAGRPYYSCGTCNWCRWGDGLGSSQTTSPILKPEPDASQVLGAQAAPLPAGRFVTDKQCRYPCCMVTRVNRKCQHHMCRKHCRASGGCTSQGHTSHVPRPLPANPSPTLLHQPSSGSTPAESPFSPSISMSKTDRSFQPAPSTLPIIVQDLQPSFPSTPSSNSLPSLPPPAQVSSSLLSASISSVRQSSSVSQGPILSSTSSWFQSDSHPTPTPPATTVPMADPSLNPRHVTKLSPTFAEHVARVHGHAEQKRQLDEEMKRVHESVIAFSYPEDDTDPVVVEFQDGFIYPYFELTRSVLLNLELNPWDAFPVIHYFNPALDVWVKMKVDSVIELTKPSQRLFFKATHVTSCLDFDHHFEASMTPTTYPQVPNFRTGGTALSEERRYVRQQIIAKAHKLEPVDELLELPSKKEIDDLARPQKHTTIPKQPPISPRMLDIQSNSHLAHNSECVCVSSDPFGLILLDDGESTELDDAPLTRAGSTARLVPGIDPSLARFPSTFYATDVHAAFCFKGRGGLTMKTWFENFFRLPWKSSTYYDHKARWFSAPLDARDQAVAAGYTETGRYSLFLAAHAAKDAEVKATRQRALAAQRAGILSHS